MPPALLVQSLVCAGNMIGCAPYYQVESDHHHVNLYVALVGESAKARKGTSRRRVHAIMKIADERWHDDHVKPGLSSGEGLINEVRDPVQKWDPDAKMWKTCDPGIADKRLMIVEDEFAGALSVMERHGNTLSPILRKAWDGGRLATLTKNAPISSTRAHISIIAHILRRVLGTSLLRSPGVLENAPGVAARYHCRCFGCAANPATLFQIRGRGQGNPSLS